MTTKHLLAAFVVGILARHLLTWAWLWENLP